MITLLLLSLFLLFLTKRGGQGPLGPSPSAGFVQTFIHSSPDHIVMNFSIYYHTFWLIFYMFTEHCMNVDSEF